MEIAKRARDSGGLEIVGRAEIIEGISSVFFRNYRSPLLFGICSEYLEANILLILMPPAKKQGKIRNRETKLGKSQIKNF